MERTYKITAKELRSMWLRFFESKNHAIIKNSSVVPQDDPTVLFTTAGMQPLVPYLLGEKHPQGTRLANVQTCIRTGDIDDIGDKTHCTGFEMLGSWSLGDYFKKEAIAFSFEFLTSPQWLNIPLENLAFTVFEGNADAPRDEVAATAWRSHGVKDDQLFYLPKKENWWGLETGGPCGPCSEMFIVKKPRCSAKCTPACDCGAYVEIWNDVFMEYNKTPNGLVPLEKPNIDTGMGLERALIAINGLNSVYEIDTFQNALHSLSDAVAIANEEMFRTSPEQTQLFQMRFIKQSRIILDHIRASCLIMGDMVKTVPSNSGRGYVLRRLIRRALVQARALKISPDVLLVLAGKFIEEYQDSHPHIKENRGFILIELEKEFSKFSKTLEQGVREFEKLISKKKQISGVDAFRLFDTFGFPIEITKEMARERGIEVDEQGFNVAFEEHRKKSQTANAGVNAGGMAGNDPKITNLHTATHLLLAALNKVLGKGIEQRGSNITAERLRFDFSFDRKLEKEELDKIEKLVNEQIKKGLKISFKEMTVKEAKAKGAIGIFGDKYGEIVKVYSMGDFSMELCGGPHAQNTKDLGTFKIQKEEASSSGVRRIKATLE
ncbi:MAG: alanine--tRNA ligase [Firmicutes bacterium]|nr:alanine--tRNA ligase [Bacillota bacterium]